MTMAIRGRGDTEGNRAVVSFNDIKTCMAHIKRVFKFSVTA